MKLTPAVSLAPTSTRAMRARWSLSGIAVAVLLSACVGDPASSSSSDTSNGGATVPTVSGTVSGLTASGLVLSNGTDAVSVSANASAFSIPAGGSLAIAHQPIGFDQACALGGTASSPQVSCSTGMATVSWWAGNNYNSYNGLLPHGRLIEGADGRLYGYNDRVIYSVAPSGDGGFTVLAGSPWESSLVNGQGTAARFNSISDVRMDNQGNLYVWDIDAQENAILRKVTPAGVVTTLSFTFPNGIWAFDVDAAGEVNYVDNNQQALFHVDAQGTQTTVVDLSLATHAAAPGHPYHIDSFVLKADGTLFFADQINASVYKLYTHAASGTAPTLLAGSDDGTQGDVDGTGSAARLTNTSDLSLGPNDTLYVTDEGGTKVKRISSTGVVHTLSGSDVVSNWNSFARLNLGRDGSTLYLSQNRFDMPVLKLEGLSLDAATATPIVNSYVMAGKTGSAKAANLSGMVGASADASGNVYVNDFDYVWNATSNAYDQRQVLRKISPQGVISTAGVLGINPDGNNLVVLKVGADGQVYAGYLCAIARMSPAGTVTTLMGDPTDTSCTSTQRLTDLAADASGNVYFTRRGGSLNLLDVSGTVSTLSLVDGSSNAFSTALAGLTLGSANQLYAVSATRVFQVALSAQGNVVTPVAGTGNVGNADGAALSTATFQGLAGIARDALGNLYVTQVKSMSTPYATSALRQITTSGTVRTLAGNSNVGRTDGRGTQGGITSAAMFYTPFRVTASPTGEVYVLDNGEIRKVEAMVAPVLN